MISQFGLSNFVQVVGPLPRDMVLDGVAAVLMPSRFEGVPLIMLEALGAGVPFIGSDIDIFASYLPGIAIDAFEDPHQLVSSIEPSLDSSNRNIWVDLQKRILKQHSAQQLLEATDEMLGAGLPISGGPIA